VYVPSVLLVMVLVGWPVLAAAQAITTFYHDFEDGQTHVVSRTTMAIKPAVVTEGSQKFLRLTHSTNNCDSTPDGSCPPGGRTEVFFTSGQASMPLISAAPGQSWTYEMDIRFSSDAGMNAEAMQLFMDGTENECYGCQNGTGPVFRLWRGQTTGTNLTFMHWTKNETSLASAVRTVLAGTWHTYKVVVIWSHDPSIGRLEAFFDGARVLNVSGVTVLGDDSNRIPAVRVGPYGPTIPNGTIMDVDNVAAYPTDQGRPPPDGTPTPTPQILWADDTGSGTACTEAQPCTSTQALALHHGGDTIKLRTGTYGGCSDCLKSGTAARPTLVECVDTTTPIAVGALGASVAPGTCTVSVDTGYGYYAAPGREYITWRGVNFVTTGAGSEFLIRLGHTTSNNTVRFLRFENADISAPTRVGNSACLRTSGLGASQIVLDRVRVHDCSSSGGAHGLLLVRPDISVVQSDIYANQGHGIFAECTSCVPANDRMTLTGNRIFGNSGPGLYLGDGVDQRLSGNLIYANGREGYQFNAAVQRVEAFNNSIHGNGLLANVPGVSVALGAMGVIRNEIVADHPVAELSIPASGIACSDLLSSDASEPNATACTNLTLNAVDTDVWEDPTHVTLASRNYALKAGSVALDNGTSAICTSTDTSANRCTPVLTLAGYSGSAPDQGAIEATGMPIGPQTIADLALDTNATDTTSWGNSGTATSITWDSTNKVEGAGSASFNAASDRITLPLQGASPDGTFRGLSVRLSGRRETLGALRYLFGHSSSATSYADRIQLKVATTDRLAVGLGDQKDLLTTTFTVAVDTWYRVALVVHPGTAGGGGGLFEVYADGGLVGSGSYTGLSQFGATATIGNNGVGQNESWAGGGTGQIDKVIVDNYALTAAEIAADCDLYCAEPAQADPLELGGCFIGVVSNSVINCEILAGADPAICSPLSNYQVTYDAVAQTESACTVTGTASPELRLTLAAAAQAGQVVELTISDFDDPFDVLNQINAPPGPLVMVNGQSSVDGLTEVITLAAPLPSPTVCATLSDFRLRDNCVETPLTGCSLSGNVLQLTRAVPPVDATVSIDVTYFPTDQRLGLTNLYDPGTGVADIHQRQWRMRPVGADDATRYEGRPNGWGSTSSPGSIGIRFGVTNESGATVDALGFNLHCARQLSGQPYSLFQRVMGGLVSDPYNSLGLRYDPGPGGIADNTVLATVALPLGAGISAHANRRYRRQVSSTVRYTVPTMEQLEEEHAVQVQGGQALGTNYVCRLYNTDDVPLASYAGVSGCVSGEGPYVVGQVPCGAPFTIAAPSWQRR
jgi:parallel beta-helix repeat protein